MNDQNGAKLGRPAKGWAALNTNVSPEAKARLLAHRRQSGVEMGALLNALILTYLEPIPEDQLPPVAPGDGLCGKVELALLGQGIPPEEIKGAWDMLSVGLQDALLASEGAEGRKALRKAYQALRKAHSAPEEAADALAWVGRRPKVLKAVSGVLDATTHLA